MDRPARLLLVEDERSLRTLVAQYLDEIGYRVVEAADGLVAVERFEREGPFDLVLLDLNLPGIPGIEVCRRIRRLCPDQPVLIVSGAILPQHDLELDAMGVSEQLTKPYHPEELRERIERILCPEPARQSRALAFGPSVE